MAGAGGIAVVLPPTRTAASNLIRTSICRVSSSKEYYSYIWAPNHRRLRFAPPCIIPFTRLLCSCSLPENDAIDMAKYKEIFSKRMAIAGLKPHHRIAIGVSGGPDSIAMCVLAADWKASGLDGVAKGCNNFIDGILGIVVDHGLRAESKDEAKMVHHRVINMGIRCEIAQCEWSNGRPKKGHLLEAARDMRYQIFHNICIQHQISVLLIAHHADDQAELFILRLSRNSGVLGLAGMASSSELFSTCPSPYGEASNGILLVRPLLEFSKHDLYKICQGGNQTWVEDPTNKSPIFARNRIRMSLGNLSTSIFKSELQAAITACRRTRIYVDQICHKLIQQTVTVMPQGYVVVDLKLLNPSNIQDICLSKFVALLLQFISQRQKPVRGSAMKLLLDYIRTFPCKTSLTAAGCYLCAAPGSKGTELLICCAVNFSKMELSCMQSMEEQKHNNQSEIDQIVAYGKSYSDQMVPDPSDVHFLDLISSESILTEAQKLNILSESTVRSILTLQRVEMEHFKPKSDITCDGHVKTVIESRSTSSGLHQGQIGYFMNRFVVMWNLTIKIPGDTYCMDGADYCCRSCLVGPDMILQVRHMVDTDWLYLAKLLKLPNLEKSQQSLFLDMESDQGKVMTNVHSGYVCASAQKALLLLKSIPVAARRSLPVLVTSEGKLLSIPSVRFNHCPCLKVSVEFKPRVPLGGGHSSFI